MNRNLIKKIDGLLIEIPSSIYNPAEDSFLLAENSIIYTNEKVLEIGSGTGYVSIYLAKKYPLAEFFAIDIDQIASMTTAKNAKNNSINIHTITSDLFDSLISKSYFDVILFNSPYLPVFNEKYELIAWIGGKNGLEITKRFLQNLNLNLKESGRAYLVVSTLTNNKKLISLLEKNHFSYKIIDQVKEGRERLLLYKITFDNKKR